MRIYSMTATFGKLEHQVLTLEPGLNIIEAPNEWGKSTWCAFLINMLYGIDTKARTTAATLADKERYAPWSGSPMAGRIDLNWNGRDITIERSSKGRVIFGNFRAYETETGLDVTELNGLNCGQMLLGVERPVFTRAGFLKLSDLPVTQDDSLRRRLNNLVTTGDESGAGDRLGERLRDLKNKCRHNRTGLLPTAEGERDQLKNQLSNLHGLQNQAESIRNQQVRLEQIIADLENHAAALRYEANLENIRRVELAREQVADAKSRLETMIDLCRTLPAREEAQRRLTEAAPLQAQQMALGEESRTLPVQPQEPQTQPCFRGLTPEEATRKAEADSRKNQELEYARRRTGILYGVAAGGALALLVAGWLLELLVPMAIAGVALLLAGIIAGFYRTQSIRKKILALYDRYPGMTPAIWNAEAAKYGESRKNYEEKLEIYRQTHESYNIRKTALENRIQTLTQGESLEDAQNAWAKTVAAWDALSDARRDLEQKDSHANVIQSMIRDVAPPKRADSLTYGEGDTTRLLTDAHLKQRQLHTQLGQCLGQAEALGSEDRIRSRLDTLNRRIERLEDTYYALEMAQDALRDATNSLQRRFAPRISKRSQELFGKLTAQRYQRLTLGEDLSLSVSAQDEDTLHGSQWRSDGTADQLYFALRLAVAEELTPEAPLVLDDALVRFDGERMKAAMEILKEEAENKQVILFTCQHREKEWEKNQ